MPQLHLPMFPSGVTPITDVLAFGKQDGRVTYFSGQLPVFSHAEDDVASFRMITSQRFIEGATQESWSDPIEKLPKRGAYAFMTAAAKRTGSLDGVFERRLTFTGSSAPVAMPT